MSLGECSHAGQVPVTKQDLVVAKSHAQQLGRSMIECGAGSFGQVYQPLLEGGFVVKAPRLNLSDRDFIAAKQQLDFEIDVLGSINHINIINLVSDHELGDLPFLVMQSMLFTLADFIETKGQHCHENELFNILIKDGDYNVYARKIVRGLSYLHENGIVHRDLKSENILIGKYRDLKIADFGLAARQHKGAYPQLPGKTGSLLYMAPELMTSELVQVSPAIDLYALGVVFYEMYIDRLMENQVRLPKDVSQSNLDELKGLYEDGRLFVPNRGHDPFSLIFMLVKALTASNPIKRPNADQVKSVLLSGRDVSEISYYRLARSPDTGASIELSFEDVRDEGTAKFLQSIYQDNISDDTKAELRSKIQIKTDYLAEFARLKCRFSAYERDIMTVDGMHIVTTREYESVGIYREFDHKQKSAMKSYISSQSNRIVEKLTKKADDDFRGQYLQDLVSKVNTLLESSRSGAEIKNEFCALFDDVELNAGRLGSETVNRCKIYLGQQCRNYEDMNKAAICTASLGLFADRGPQTPRDAVRPGPRGAFSY